VKKSAWGRETQWFGESSGTGPWSIEDVSPLTLQPGQGGMVGVRKGSRAISEMIFRIEAQDVASALRQVVLRIEFDGHETVTCPLGDFFGTTPGLNPYESLPVTVTADGYLVSHWFMPFEERTRLALENRGSQDVGVVAAVTSVPYRWTDRSMYFHARWRINFDVPTRPMQDWNYVSIHGQGVFVGAAFAIANPVKNWWGEGDEKIYIDGESFPSHFGTGTEDYFGYAWCSPEPFRHAYHNQPRCDGPGNYGHTAVNRWHIVDRVPFGQSFRFDMELWHWHDECKVTPSVATYWYARPGATSNIPPLTMQDLRLATIPTYVAARVPGALEGEELDVAESTGVANPQSIDPCSNELHLWWREAKPGDKLVVAFPVEQTGRYRVLIRCVKARDYGVVQLYINGQPAGEPIDLYNDGIVATDELSLGEFNLQEGANTLTAEIVGANEAAVKGYMFGLDYIRLEATE
jgi:hypothetical protein